MQDRRTTREARSIVSKIAKLKIDRVEFDKQAEALKQTNAAFQSAEYNSALVAEWVPASLLPVVPDAIVNAVVVVPK